jgi:4a-hydroxytetrahydrobiopterin dehydratase
MSEWRQEGETLVRDYQFKDFAAAMAYVNRVADLAEEVNHHPDILVHGWNKLRLTPTTHSAGGLTENDHEMARRIDALGDG